MDLVLVTGSAAKAREARDILGKDLEQVEIDLPEIQAATVEEVAREKSREAFRRIERACVVEDSALGFAAWGELPGPFIKWFEKAAGLEALCRSLDGFADRSATAICVLAYRSETDQLTAVGRAEGTIALHPRGSGGFGWDSIFIPLGFDRTFAEMPPEEKNAVSHRRKAWEELRRKI
ncbi:MAG: non-canonical purine NTP pyrophosphatase [Thermoanaerobaculia bacterium]